MSRCEEELKTIRLHLVKSLHQTQIMAATLVLEPGPSASLFRLRFGHWSNYSQPNQTDGLIQPNSSCGGPWVPTHDLTHTLKTFSVGWKG